eukprot:3899509-Amphidinium_carterae.1
MRCLAGLLSRSLISIQVVSWEVKHSPSAAALSLLKFSISGLTWSHVSDHHMVWIVLNGYGQTSQGECHKRRAKPKHNRMAKVFLGQEVNAGGALQHKQANPRTKYKALHGWKDIVACAAAPYYCGTSSH